MIVDDFYSLPEDFKRELSSRPIQWGFGQYSEAIYYRTYSRLKQDGTQERWADTVIRVVEGEFSILKWRMRQAGIHFHTPTWDVWAEQTATYMFDFKLLPPGRGLWAGGTEHVFKVGNAALNNCGFVDVRNLSSDAGWLADQLMLGVGVGFRTDHWGEYLYAPLPEAEDEAFDDIYEQFEQAKILDPVKKGYYFSEDDQIYADQMFEAYGVFAIPDSREGWVASIVKLIDAYVLGRKKVRFYYGLIRPLGAPINGFGGTASGPEPLIALHVRLEERLNAFGEGGVSRSELVTDVMNLIGRCVVAGNVRRSAEIALGRVDDDVFLNLKNSELYPQRNDWTTGWGHLSNNSVILEDDDEFEQLPRIVDGIIRNGEPGFINLQAIQKWGRLGKPKEDLAVGANPCGEIPLESYELCNLCEVFPTRCASNAEYFTALKLATLYASIISLLPSHDSRTNEVVARNHRIGVSLSGLADWKDAIGVPALTRVLRDGYRVVEQTNSWLARMVGISPSVRLTTVKPSGTISQLAGVSSGMHHSWDRWFLRRVRFGATSPIVDILQASGVPFEPDVKDPNGTVVFEFPLEVAGGITRPQAEVSIWEQIAFVAQLQRDWADNMVSNTLTFGPDEEDQIIHALGMFAPVIKSTSVLPDLDAYARAKGAPPAYQQAPYEKITREEYRRRKREISIVDWNEFGGSDGEDSRYCTDDACEVTF